MTLEEKAQEYALKALEEQIVAVKQAYIDGYNAAKAKYNHEPIVDENGIKWYDMDLPSGNLWSEPLKDEEGNYIESVYNRVNQLDLPTDDDFKELKNHSLVMCKLVSEEPHLICVSVNGCQYQIKTGLYWLKSDVHNNWGRMIYAHEKNSNGYLEISPYTCTSFIGFERKVVLVKRKN